MEETLQMKYERLKNKLREETGMHSNPNIICRNQNCQDIVAMGMDVVPFILKDMQKSLSFEEFGTGESGEYYPGWGIVLSLPKMTGAKPEDLKKAYTQHGAFVGTNVKKQAEAWVAWGISQGLINV